MTGGAVAGGAVAGGARWTGGFAEREVGIRVQTDALHSLVPVELLVGVALRQNPRRAHLLVSYVLAKHVPTVPGLAIVSAELLGLLVAAELDGGPVPLSLYGRLAGLLRLLAAPRPDAGVDGGVDAGVGVDVGAGFDGGVDAGIAGALAALRGSVGDLRVEHPEVTTIGYAETATGLGHLVAETIGSYYLHSTRHAPLGRIPFAGFEEEHSHATSHQLYPARPDWLKPGGTVVLVDDELSTGATIVNTIRALQAAVPQARWVVASLVDLRSATDRARFDALGEELGCAISVVALGHGSIDLPPDVTARATVALAAHGTLALDPAPSDEAPPARSRGLERVSTRAGGARGVPSVAVVETATLPIARFGIDARPGMLADVATDVAAALRPLLRGERVLVLGSEEYIALPLAVADHLAGSIAVTAAEAIDAADSDTDADARAGDKLAAHPSVWFSTTTRSPIGAIDRPDYAIASAVTFRSHDRTTDGPGPRFAYNLTRGGLGFDTIVFVAEPGADCDRMLGSDGVAEALLRVAGHVIIVVQATPPAPDAPLAEEANRP